LESQQGRSQPWTIRQKQTGVDRVTLGGALASNIHGRGLRFAPFVQDIESFLLVDSSGQTRQCSRRENSELFSLAIGGYGLFGVVTHIKLRLMPRMKMKRLVEVIPMRELLARAQSRLHEGCIYGDCQYSTDLETEAGAHAGVFSCYQPVPIDQPIPEGQKHLASDDWAELYGLARTNKKKAFERYSTYYAATSGQLYWSDTLQLAAAFQDYSKAVDPGRGSEVITEIYVSHENFLPLVSAARQDCRDHQVDMTYGTIRFIEPDTTTFLAWARRPSVCIVCNLHVEHHEAGIQKAMADFRRIIDRAIEFGGS
jgi:FAD/FMN-containing dehydrogenase